jgi:hypothetical protein
MAKSGNTKMTWNEEYFATVARQPAIARKADEAAERVLAKFRETAPVGDPATDPNSGSYRDSGHIEHHRARYRDAARVEVSDPKALLIEAKTGTLARALKAAKG